MSYIYIVRHGQSLGNLKGGFAGHTDFPLSDLGKTQARMTADYLKDTQIDAVLSSTLTRAKQTAEPIAADRGLSVIPCPEFIEMNFGDWEGKPLDAVEEEYNGAVTVWKTTMYKTVCPNGESTVECYNRAVRALENAAKQYADKDICIVSHGALIKCMHCHLLGLPIEELQSVMWADNASVMTIENDNGNLTLIREPYSAHMGEFVTGVSKAMGNFKK